jgi:hypothetical protein
MGTRAKFRCNSVNDFGGGSKEVSLSVVYDPNGNDENANFTKATPSGEMKMRIDNPAASVQFDPGKYYYVDFTPAEA